MTLKKSKGKRLSKNSEQLILSPEVFPVSRSASQADEKEQTTIDISGQTCLESSKKLSQGGLLEKMCEVLLTSKTAWSSKLCALTWKVKATKHKRLLFQLQASVRPIGEKESGLWATPNTMDHLPQRSPEALRRQATTTRKGRTRPANLREQVNPVTVKMWRTPDALAGGSNLPGIKKALDQGHLKRPSGLPIQIRLHDQVREKRLWPTPRASNPGSRPNQKGGKILQEEVLIAEGIRTRGQKLWPTPVQDDVHHRKKKYKQGGTALSTKVGGTLTPTWVEWLMGYPAWYTDLKDWEILSSRKSRKKSATPSLKQKEMNEDKTIHTKEIK